MFMWEGLTLMFTAQNATERDRSKHHREYADQACCQSNRGSGYLQLVLLESLPSVWDVDVVILGDFENSSE